MAPRHDRTHSGSFSSSTRLRSSLGHAGDNTRPYHDLAPRGAVCELSSNESKMRTGAGSQVKRKKVTFIPPQTFSEGWSSDNEESLMWKLKRIEAQAQARELRRKIHKQNQEIRHERRELRRLKTIERELVKFLEACEQHELQQQLQQSQHSDLFKSNFSRVHVLIAAVVSCFLLRFFTYASFAVNRL